MAAIFLLLLVVCCVPALRADDKFFMDPEEMQAIQDNLARLEGLEKAYKAVMFPEEAREEACLPEGAGCSFASGLDCCGVRMRCIVFDHYTPQKGGVNKWHSICREYKGGVAVDEIAQFFKNMG